MTNKVAFITGVTGQDGSWLSELLLSHNYNVYGLSRRKSTDDGLINLQQVINNPNFHLVSGDITDQVQIVNLVNHIKPDEVYNLAAMSFVAESFNSPKATMEINTIGTLNVLDAVKASNSKKEIKVYLAGSSEMFGKVVESPQTEGTPMNARSPYAVSKIAGFELGRNYRDSFNMFVCNGILFNHSSTRRGYEFMMRKISNYVGQLYNGKTDSALYMGNLEAKRDIGSATDYVEAMYLMMQRQTPDDYVIATGKTHSVRDVCRSAFNVIGKNYEDYVQIDPRFYRPSEVDVLLGDASKAKEKLNWEPTISFAELIKEMVDNDIKIWKEKGE